MPDATNMTTFESLVALACLIAVALIGAYVLITGTPPTTTAPAARKTIRDQIPGGLKGPIYELGSGLGILAVSLARRAPWCRVVGIEMSPVIWLISKLVRLAAGANNLELRKGNFHTIDLSPAAMVVMFLGRGPMRILRPKLSRELRPGTLIVSNMFAIPGWTPVAELDSGSILRGRVFVYRMGEGTDADAPYLFDGR